MFNATLKHEELEQLDQVFPAPEGIISYRTILEAAGRHLGDRCKWGPLQLQRKGARLFTHVSILDAAGASGPEPGTVYGIRASYDGSQAIEITPGHRFAASGHAVHREAFGFMPVDRAARLKNTRHALDRVESGALDDIVRAAIGAQGKWKAALKQAAEDAIPWNQAAMLLFEVIQAGFPTTKFRRVRELWANHTVYGFLCALFEVNAERGPAVRIPAQWNLMRDVAQALKKAGLPVRW